MTSLDSDDEFYDIEQAEYSESVEDIFIDDEEEILVEDDEEILVEDDEEILVETEEQEDKPTKEKKIKWRIGPSTAVQAPEDVYAALEEGEYKEGDVIYMADRETIYKQDPGKKIEEDVDYVWITTSQRDETEARIAKRLGLEEKRVDILKEKPRILKYGGKKQPIGEDIERVGRRKPRGVTRAIVPRRGEKYVVVKQEIVVTDKETGGEKVQEKLRLKRVVASESTHFIIYDTMPPPVPSEKHIRDEQLRTAKITKEHVIEREEIDFEEPPSLGLRSNASDRLFSIIQSVVSGENVSEDIPKEWASLSESDKETYSELIGIDGKPLPLFVKNKPLWDSLSTSEKTKLEDLRLKIQGYPQDPFISPEEYKNTQFFQWIEYTKLSEINQRLLDMEKEINNKTLHIAAFRKTGSGIVSLIKEAFGDGIFNCSAEIFAQKIINADVKKPTRLTVFFQNEIRKKMNFAYFKDARGISLAREISNILAEYVIANPEDLDKIRNSIIAEASSAIISDLMTIYESDFYGDEALQKEIDRLYDEYARSYKSIEKDIHRYFTKIQSLSPPKEQEQEQEQENSLLSLSVLNSITSKSQKELVRKITKLEFNIYMTTKTTGEYLEKIAEICLFTGIHTIIGSIALYIKSKIRSGAEPISSLHMLGMSHMFPEFFYWAAHEGYSQNEIDAGTGDIYDHVRSEINIIINGVLSTRLPTTTHQGFDWYKYTKPVSKMCENSLRATMGSLSGEKDIDKYQCAEKDNVLKCRAKLENVPENDIIIHLDEKDGKFTCHSLNDILYALADINRGQPAINPITLTPYNDEFMNRMSKRYMHLVEGRESEFPHRVLAFDIKREKGKKMPKPQRSSKIEQKITKRKLQLPLGLGGGNAAGERYIKQLANDVAPNADFGEEVTKAILMIVYYLLYFDIPAHLSVGINTAGDVIEKMGFKGGKYGSKCDFKATKLAQSEFLNYTRKLIRIGRDETVKKSNTKRQLRTQAIKCLLVFVEDIVKMIVRKALDKRVKTQVLSIADICDSIQKISDVSKALVNFNSGNVLSVWKLMI